MYRIKYVKSPTSTENFQPEPESKDEGFTTPKQAKNKRIPVAEYVEREPEKRGFWSRF